MKKWLHSYERNRIVYVKGTINGRRYRLSTGRRASKKTLEYVHQNWESEISRLCLISESRNTKTQNRRHDKFRISFQDFCIKLQPIWEATLKHSTFQTRMGLLRNILYPAFGKTAIQRIDYAVLREWFFNFRKKNGHKPSAGYCANIASLLSAVFEEAKKSGIVPQNPMVGLKKPKPLPKNNPTPFSHEEIAKILRCNDAFVRDFATIAFFTGMRTGELLALAWDCIDFENDTIHVERNATFGAITTPKTGKRSIDMLPCVKSKLLQMYARKKSCWVFVHSRNKNYTSSSSIAYRWQRALLECNIAYRSVYHTRHTFATTMISAGEDILWVSATLGHANTQMTFARYAKYIPKTRRQRASIVEQNIAQLLAQHGNALAL